MIISDYVIRHQKWVNPADTRRLNTVLFFWFADVMASAAIVWRTRKFFIEFKS